MIEREVLFMNKTVLTIEGRMCCMCEAHVKEAILKEYPDADVTASHDDGKAVVMMTEQPDEKKLTEAVEGAGFKVTGVENEASADNKFKLFGRK